MSKISEVIEQMSVEEMKQRLASYMAAPMASVSTTTSKPGTSGNNVTFLVIYLAVSLEKCNFVAKSR